MINGIEDFLENNDTSKIDELVHHKVADGAESNITSSNRGASRIFYNMAEQIVGADLYKELMGLQSAGVDFYRAIEQYREKLQAYNDAVATNNQTANNLFNEKTTLEKERDLLRAPLQAAMAANMKLGANGVRFDEIVDRIAELDKEITDLAFDPPKAPDTTAVAGAKKVLCDRQSHAKQADTLKRTKIALEKLKAEKAKIIQGMVDGTLLPGDEGKEATVRKCAETMFDLAVVEIESYIKSCELADSLVVYDAKNPDYSADIPKATSHTVAQVEALSDVAEIITENPYNLFTDQRFSDFVGGGLQKWRAKEPITVQTMFDLGKEQGIPATKNQARRKFLWFIPYGKPVELHLQESPYSNIAETFAKLSELDRPVAETISTLVSPIGHEINHVQAKKVNLSKAGIKKAGASLASVVAMQSHETKIDATSLIAENVYIDAAELKPKSTNGQKLVLPNGNTIDINPDGNPDGNQNVQTDDGMELR